MSGPTHWTPRLSRQGGPYYRQIAKALANDIRAGVLAPGALVPAQRDLAQRLGVTVSTVTKAYNEVGRLNLIAGHARAGTRVVQRAPSVAGWRGARPDGAASIDLASNSVGTERFLHELATALPGLSASPRFGDLQEYPPVAGHPHHRAVLAEWLRGRDIQATGDDVVVTSGAHQAIVATLAALASEGATLLAERMTYAPLGPLAASLKLRVEPIEMDRDGIDPSAAERLFRRVRKPVLFVTPNLNNPTTATLTASRRQALVSAARRFDARIVEDDVFALLAEHELPALAAMAPERVYYITSFAKAVAPGLRAGVVRAPDSPAAQRIAAQVGLATRMAPTLYVELACLWIEDGTLERIVTAHRVELERRVELARSVLRPYPVRAGRYGPHLWLPLPRGLAQSDVVRRTGERGVDVLPSAGFCLGGDGTQALRITITAPRDLAQVATGLQAVRDSLA